MAKQKINSFSALVYSTNPDQKLDDDIVPEAETLPNNEQRIRLRLETKHRGGKAVTVVDGFVGTQTDMEALCKALKNHCGTGGSAKNGELLIQGDHREKVKAYLIKQGYKDVK